MLKALTHLLICLTGCAALIFISVVWCHAVSNINLIAYLTIGLLAELNIKAQIAGAIMTSLCICIIVFVVHSIYITIKPQ